MPSASRTVRSMAQATSGSWVATTIVVDLLGGLIFDFDVNLLYRNVFRKLDQMVAKMKN